MTDSSLQHLSLTLDCCKHSCAAYKDSRASGFAEAGARRACVSLNSAWGCGSEYTAAGKLRMPIQSVISSSAMYCAECTTVWQDCSPPSCCSAKDTALQCTDAAAELTRECNVRCALNTVSDCDERASQRQSLILIFTQPLLSFAVLKRVLKRLTFVEPLKGSPSDSRVCAHMSFTCSSCFLDGRRPFNAMRRCRCFSQHA